MSEKPENRPAEAPKPKRPLPPVETRFKPGQTGNAGGVPKWVHELRAKLGGHVEEAAEILLATLRSKKTSTAHRLLAVKLLFDYSGARPPAAVELSGKGGGPIRFGDLSKLSEEQLDQLEQLVRAATVGAGDEHVNG